MIMMNLSRGWTTRTTRTPCWLLVMLLLFLGHYHPHHQLVVVVHAQEASTASAAAATVSPLPDTELPVAEPAEAEAAVCSQEFEPCYFRDCCGNHLSCVTMTGDIASTTTNANHHRHLHRNHHDNNNNHHAATSSVCLSDRSVALDAESDHDKEELLRRVYEELVPLDNRKSTIQIQQMMDRHAHGHTFSQLVARLETRYKISVSN